jgi:diacylglycerol kinase (ATP)
MKNSNILSRAKFSVVGLRHAWSNERSLRTQAILSLIVIAIMAWDRSSLLEWLVVLLALATASAMELINAAIEALADCLHPEPHPSIGAVKDMASAAAFVLNCCCAILVLIILFR